ncbi:Holliday junction resolvase RuvX [Chitinibacteraceae bacterium HSL-7]
MAAVLGFDFGLVRLGVALGDTETGLAHPLETITSDSNDVRFARIAALITEWQPVTLVVGLPLTEDGEEQEASRLSRKFANRLGGRFGLPVALFDERFSSAAATEALNETGRRGRKQKPVLDQVAAMRILQDWLDAR